MKDQNEDEEALPEASTAATPSGPERPGSKRLPRAGFPHPPLDKASQLPGTIENLAHLLGQHGISVSFDVIKKRINIANKDGTKTSTNEVLSVAALNSFPTNHLFAFIDELAMQSQANPIKDFILSKPWDGKDRLEALLATVTTEEGYPDLLKKQLITRWLLSVVAAALKPSGFHSRGVLTLQGPQGCGKTSWFSLLVPTGALREDYLKLDHHMDGGSKDSIITAVSHWIVEIGELDSSFKKDIARLKGFLTNDCDKLRRPYARGGSEYPRRTVFGASVNEERYLQDSTGNSRWWTIPVVKLDYNHDIDMQQLYAQLAVRYAEGEQWWLDAVEETLLGEWNKRHRNESATAERVRDYLDANSLGGREARVTPSKLLEIIGISRPTNLQCKECGAVLREILGPPKRIRGRDKWLVQVAYDANLDPEPPVY
jgi:putative DNA primase/helicase